MKPEDAVEKLIAAIEKVAPKTWETMVAYQRAEALTELLIFTLLGAFAVGVTLLFRRKYHNETNTYDQSSWLAAGIVSAFVALLFLGVAVPLNVLQLLTPEYGAIEKLLEVVK